MDFFNNMDKKKLTMIIVGVISVFILFNLILSLLGLNVFLLPFLLAIPFAFPQVRDKVGDLKDKYLSSSDDDSDDKV